MVYGERNHITSLSRRRIVWKEACEVLCVFILFIKIKLMCLPIIHRTWLKNIFRIWAISECKRYLKKKIKHLSNSQILDFCKEYCFLLLVPKHEVEIYKWNKFSWMFRKHYLFQAWGPKINVQTPLAISELYFSSILLVVKMKISECLGGGPKNILFFKCEI